MMSARRKRVVEGSKAPDFVLPTDDGGTVSLAGLRGKTLVLYFYPKDDTPGCTKEALEFSAAGEAFSRSGAVVVGVSKDPPDRHAKFRAKHDLSVLLASDRDGAMIDAYGAWIEKTLYGRNYMGIDRSTFVIDGKGVVRRIWRKVRVAGHAAEVLAAVQTLN